MSWNTLIFAAAVSAIALVSPHANAEAPTTAPAAVDSGEHEVTEAERAKLEADSEAATTAPAAVATAATTQPAVPVVPPTRSRSYSGYGSSTGSTNGVVVMPSSYYTLMSRSIFIKGSQEVFDPLSRGGNSYRPRDDRPSSLFPTTQSSSSRPETTLIFDGATHADGRFRALIEDTGTHAITPVSPGDRLASGTITALTLDTLDYTVGTHTTHVGVGQNLDGVDAALGGAAAGGSSSGFTTTPSSATPSSGGDSSAAPAASNDILEKLKKRRQQELTGK